MGLNEIAFMDLNWAYLVQWRGQWRAVIENGV